MVGWYEPRISTFVDFLKDVEKWKLSQNDPQTLVEPQDSISNVSRKSKRSAGSSAVSSTASARLKVATERAVLLAREKTLEKKHALDIQCSIKNQNGTNGAGNETG